jgi:hypothetical protein
MALDTITDYLAEARILLQDERVPVRYKDSELISALNIAMMEARRLRPDILLGASPGSLAVPEIGATDPMASIDIQFRTPLLYFVVGHAFERDEEEGASQRAMSYKQRFATSLLAVGAV